MSTQKLFYIEEQRVSMKVNMYWTDTYINQPHLGDNWDDVPYDHNAGPPYDYSMMVTIDLRNLPGVTFPPSEFSINMINEGIVPWLKYGNYTLYAGATPRECMFFVLMKEIAAIKIQRLWKGFLGRRVAAELRYRPSAIGFLGKND